MRTAIFCLLALLSGAWSLACSDQALYNPPDPQYPAIEVTPLDLQFGSLEIGSELTQQVTITSVGPVDLDIKGLEIIGPEHFSVEVDAAPLTLEPGAAVIARVTYAALDGSERDGVFRVSSNDVEQPTVDVTLNGAGIGPAIEIDPAQWDYGTHGVYCAETMDFEVVSTGNAPVTVDSWSYAVHDGDPEALNWSTQDLYQGLVLSPGESALVTITFEPQDVESYEGSLTVVPQEAILEATGIQTGMGEGGNWVTDEFIQEGNNQTDILWVVDNSCSMIEEQGQLADDFSNFISIVDAEAVDYHIAAVTTDSAQFLGQTKVITHSTPNGEQVFADNCQVGTNGDTTERGLLYGWEALQLAVNNTAPNTGFYRTVAGLRVVFVSDEMDGSSGDPLDYVADYQSLKSNPNHVILSAICGTDGTQAEMCWGSGGQAMGGHGYVDAALATGGLLGSICESDWSTTLTSLGWMSLSLADTLPLSQEPIPSTITVDINGVHLNQGWYYDAVINSVVLEPDYVPGDGDQVEITYQTPGDCSG